MDGEFSQNKLSLRGAHSRGPQILSTAESPRAAQRSTNPYSILRSSGRLKIVISGGLDCAVSIARRLANDLLTYFKLDADIVPETEVLETQGDTHAGAGNIVVIGGPGGQYIRRCLAKRRTAFTIADQENGPPELQLRGEPLNGLSQGNIMQCKAESDLFIIGLLTGIMFTHPHESSPSSTMLFIIAHDQSGLERAVRLFPTRTGLALADWLVIGKQADKRGAFGIEKAGYLNSF
jgi:hypothetical protein